MAIQKMLGIFVLLAATSPVYSKRVSLWDRKLFPDDDNARFPTNETQQLDERTKNLGNMENYEVCETKECKKVAKEFLSSMNKSIDPCDDFYEFACGAWSAKDPIPPSKTSWSRYMIFQNEVENRIKEALETKPDPSDILPVRQAKKWYRSCMDTENLERRGVKPIESILMQAGGWPMTMDEDSWDAELYPWQMVERHYARLTGTYTLYNVKIIHVFEDSDVGAIVISAPDIPLSDQLPLKYRNYSGNDYNMYLRFVEGAADLFVQHNRADVSKERISKEAKEIVEFEKEIFELKQKHDWASMTFDEFVEWYDTKMTEINSDPKAKIDWRSVIQGLFNLANIKVDASRKFLTDDLEYIKGIGELLKRTPARTIVNYIHWNFVAKMLPYTTERARNDLFELMNEEYGVKERAPRWSECVNDMQMKHAAAYVFVDKYFTESTESAAREMIKNIEIGMENQIEKSNWLDEESKKWAKEKLNNMRMFIGYPEWYRNRTAVINRYKGLIIGAEYFDNTLSYMRYEVQKELKHISEEEKDDIWSFIDPITVNAIYARQFNMLSIPAADFQTPLFTPQFPNNVNYATVGVIVGHEMGHGFDVNGIRYGVGPKASKLPEDVLKSYYQNAECFIDQFNGYFEGYFETEAPTSGETTSYPPKRSMGERTREENIADSTGIQSVFEAYKKASEKSSSGETRLPGLEEFTDDQLFFLSFGAMWCEVERSEYEKKKKEAKNVHSPPKFRVIGAVSNTKNFAKAFNCPKGSPMNPRNKCNIWEKPEATIKKEPCGGSRTTNRHRWGGQWRS